MLILRDIELYQREVPGHKLAAYSEIMDYIGRLRKKYDNPQTVKTTLHGIKKYYAWLVATGQRKDHPCTFLYLKDKEGNSVQSQDLLFTTEELELLLERKERYTDLKIRNQVIIGLLIYQGITTGELTRIELQDINLDTAEIYIKASSKLNSRTLKLTPKQVLPLHKYIHEIRSKLLKAKTEKLIINKLGNAETGYQIHYLAGTFKYLLSGQESKSKNDPSKRHCQSFKIRKRPEDRTGFCRPQVPIGHGKSQTSQCRTAKEARSKVPSVTVNLIYLNLEKLFYEQTKITCPGRNNYQ